jgi:hypothetical protein
MRIVREIWNGYASDQWALILVYQCALISSVIHSCNPFAQRGCGAISISPSYLSSFELSFAKQLKLFRRSHRTSLGSIFTLLSECNLDPRFVPPQNGFPTSHNVTQSMVPLLFSDCKTCLELRFRWGKGQTFLRHTSPSN